MPHLTNTTQKSLFRTDVAERQKNATMEGGTAPMMMGPSYPDPVAVQVDMTPDQARDTRMANYPRYDWPSVRNLPARKRSYR